MKTRTEHDSLGNVEVPSNAYYGAQTARAVANFPISGIHAHRYLIRAYGLLKQACAETNLELGMIPQRKGQAVVRAAKDVAEGILDEHFVVDVYQAGAGVSFHMNVNEVIANRAIWHLQGHRMDRLGDYSIVHPNDHVNFGQSTNDTFPTAMRLASLLLLEDFYPALEELEEAFRNKGLEFDGILKSGRTHMQDAVPIRLGQEFTAYAVTLDNLSRHIRQNAGALAELGIGGSAVGTGLNAHPKYPRLVVKRLAGLTGLRLRVAPDLRAAMQSQFPLAAVSGALRNLALELIRIGNDLRLLTSGPLTGFHEIVLPALQPGSSIMPGKVNPVMGELLDMVAFQVVGCDTAVALAVQAGQLELNVMMPAMIWNVLHATEILKNTCRVVAHRCIEGIRANREVCERYAYLSPSIATALNPVIGYARAAEIVKKSLATGKTIPEVCLEDKVLSEEELKKILDPHRMTQPGLPPRRKK
ncbi:MAG TPA: aspartate ammonia-lyase [Terriglobia bacterium]|nr:aspartate ammonia-lyase [Terriglobia bacterium]